MTKQDYEDKSFRPWLVVNIRSGDIKLKRNPMPWSGDRQGCWSFGQQYDYREEKNG